VFSASPVSLGRSRTNTFVLPEPIAPTASARHAEFVHDEDVWWVIDRESSNGTYLNGQRVTRARVEAGDRLTIGDVEFVIGFVDAQARRPAVAWALLAAGAVGLALLAVSYRSASSAGDPQRIAGRASRSAYVVALEREGSRSILGTAFAVARDGALATNAHVAASLEPLLAGAAGDARAVAIRSDTFEVHRVASARRHPQWQAGSIAHDVALLLLEPGVTTSPLRLAKAGQVRRLQRGMPVSSFGFPAVSTDPARPRGRLSVDVVSDVRLPFLEVGLGISPGTSGSPVFAADGAVIAMVVSGDFVGAGGDLPQPSGSNANWAITVDELDALTGSAVSR